MYKPDAEFKFVIIICMHTHKRQECLRLKTKYNVCYLSRLKIAGHTDERVRMMNEIIAGIQVIKLYCWEKSFGEWVSKLRQ